MCIHMCIHICIHIFVYIYIYNNIYVCVYVYIYNYIYIYIYLCILTSNLWPPLHCVRMQQVTGNEDVTGQSQLKTPGDGETIHGPNP